jgi:hypothetical protein
MEQINYQIGALNNFALNIVENKKLYKYSFTEYRKAYQIVDRLNELYKCPCFRVVTVQKERKGR